MSPAGGRRDSSFRVDQLARYLFLGLGNLGFRVKGVSGLRDLGFMGFGFKGFRVYGVLGLQGFWVSGLWVLRFIGCRV